MVLEVNALRRSVRRSDGHFKMDPNSGDLILERRLSPSLKFSLTVAVTDEAGGRTESQLEVVVQDINARIFKLS